MQAAFADVAFHFLATQDVQSGQIGPQVCRFVEQGGFFRAAGAECQLSWRVARQQQDTAGPEPVDSLAQHPLAPNWHRLGRLLFNHGENFYNFQGLRAFKEKFDPVWEPRYLASPGGFAPFFILADVAALIAGGLRRVMAK